MIESTKKVKIYCTYKTKIDLDNADKYNVIINDKALLSREEFLSQIKGCHGIMSNPRAPRIDAEALDSAGNQLKVL